MPCGGLTIEQLETPVNVSADEIENELMMGTPDFIGTIGTFPAFARAQQYYLQQVAPNAENPALSKHPYSKNDDYLKVLQARAKTKPKMSFDDGLDSLIHDFFDAEVAARIAGKEMGTQCWRLCIDPRTQQSVDMSKKKAPKLDKKLLKIFREQFLDSNGECLQPSFGTITPGGGLDAPLHATKRMDKRTLERKQSAVAMHFFAITVASFFYSRTRAKEQWTTDASAKAQEKEDELEADLEGAAAAAEATGSEVAAVEDDDATVEARRAKLDSAMEAIVHNPELQQGSPLANREVPQFVRDVINVHYPLRIAELEFQLIGVEELDLLFYHASRPLQTVLSALSDISDALNDALQACHFGPNQRAEYKEVVNPTTGKAVRQRVYDGAAPTIEEALRNIKEVLRAREQESLAAAGGVRDQWTPSWAPPKFVTRDMDLGAQTVAYSQLGFSRYRLEDRPDEAINPNEDLADALSKFELWWDLNMQLYKVMGLQRNYVTFFCACARTDQLRFSETIKAQFGVDPITDEPTAALRNAEAALVKNIEAFKQMKAEVSNVMQHCSKDTAAVYKELNKWLDDWRKTEVKKAPCTVNEVLPFVCEITRSDEFDAAKRKRAAGKASAEPHSAKPHFAKLHFFSVNFVYHTHNYPLSPPARRLSASRRSTKARWTRSSTRSSSAS